MPYFPIGKIIELLNVEEKKILQLLLDSPEILEGAIVVKDFHEGKEEIYLNPVGCHLLIDCATVHLIGKKIKQMSMAIVNASRHRRKSLAKQLVRKSPPLLKAMYDWSDLGERYNYDQEYGPEPVQ